MKINLLYLAFWTCLALPSFAQTSYIVKGVSSDTASVAKLPNTSVCVLNSKDSTLVKFTRARSDGSFSITGLRAGSFILLMTYPGYADYIENFKLDTVNKERDFGVVNMILKSRLLQEVLVKGAVAAIKIKGDTTEYNASSFKIEPNAKVEDLLKQLPGIQVDNTGKITAQGETVGKVLVDGEEFFGDDPTLVTKNIRGDMVDKVQLYDKKSDQAAFTGIDDGVKTKTINLKLKENAKNGYFGKLDAGALGDSYYQGQAMFNAFKAKQKFSAYTTIGNTGKTGLGWEDTNKYGGGGNMEFMDDGGIMITGGGGDEFDSFDGRYNGEGIPLARTGGLHYDTKWNNDKQSINTNYKIGSLGIEGEKNNIVQNNLPTGLINTTSAQNFDNSVFRQKLDLIYQVKIDSSSSLKISVDGTLKNSRTRDNYNSTGLRNGNTLLNSGTRALSNDGNQTLMNASALWTKKLRKTGRTLSVNLGQNFNNNETDGYLNSDNNFYNNTGDLDSVQVVDQYKKNDTRNTRFSSNITYTEPLSKTFSVVLNYGLSLNNSKADRKSFNRTAGGSYNELDSLFSNNFRLDQLSNQAGAVFNYKKDKSIFNFGTKISAVDFNQDDVLRKNTYKRTFTNWLPQASYQYKFSAQKSLRITYNGNTSQPSIDQIQPVRINTDPLNITLGNQDLKPSFSNRFNLGYNSYKVISQQSIYFSGSYSFTMNPIVRSSVTDSAGKSTFQSVNLNDKSSSNYNAYAYYYTKLKKADLYIGFNFSIYGNTYYSYSNNALNQTTSATYSGGLSISKYKQKKYDFRISLDPGYSTNESSLQKLYNNNGWTFNSRPSFSVFLPGKLQIGADANYEFREKTQSFNENFNRCIVNSYLTKIFLKDEILKLTLSGNDLLNQNIGFRRSAYNNTITQNSYTSIKRYFLLSATWDFNKMGVKPQQ